MKTTVLFVDILIIGLLSFLWIWNLLLAFLFPINAVLNFLNNNVIVVTTISIALIYVLGILFDYTNAWIFEGFKSEAMKEKLKNISVIKILDKKPDIQKFLDNHYSRLRIARATIINIPPLTISLIILINKHIVLTKINVCLSTIILFVIGTVLMFLAIHSYNGRNKTYMKYLDHTLDILKTNP